MKTILPAVVLMLTLTACGGGDADDAEKADDAKTTSEAPANDLSSNPDYQKGLALVGQSDCLTCHKVAEASTGPAYRDVANKYANAADTTIERLANTIIAGGSGQWGTVPMTPHPSVTMDDAKAMVKYVLLLK